MAIRQILKKVGAYDDELRFIDYRIGQLTSLGQVMVNNDFRAGDLIMETLPRNGAKAIITPIFPNTAYPQTPLETILTDENIQEANIPQPIGFQRMYIPQELKNSPLLTIFLELDKNIILAVVDTVITKLKERKKQIFEESKTLLKEKPG